MSSSSNTQAVILVSVIFLVAIGTILYVNFGAAPPDHSESALTGSKRSSSSTTDDSINYNEERKSIIDCENMDPLQGPRFLGSIPNVTVHRGQNVSLPCVVENLGGFRMAWIKLQSQTILTIHSSIITRNNRIGLSVESKALETLCKNRGIESTITMYTLHINSVTSSDDGYYLCQTNTDPMKGQWGYLKVNGESEVVTK